MGALMARETPREGLVKKTTSDGRVSWGDHLPPPRERQAPFSLGRRGTSTWRRRGRKGPDEIQFLDVLSPGGERHAAIAGISPRDPTGPGAKP
jgi:hypothetical protein